MKHTHQHKLIPILLGLLSVILAQACSGGNPPAAPSGHTIAPELAGLYAELGGERVLGQAISAPFSDANGLLYQYTVAALLIYNPQTGDAFLSPLAQEWDVREPDESPPPDPAIPYVNGHRVWEEVMPYYEKYGTETLGQPLTGVRYNETKQRYEQYFERVGFYRNGNDAVGTIHLMPYGDWMCGNRCYTQIEDALPTAAPEIETLLEVDQDFLATADRLGHELTGDPLSETYLSEDGVYEKVFENVVLYLDAQSGRIGLRPLAQLLNIIPDPPVPASGVPGMYFYPVQGELGYNIPQYFMDYITAHGTLEVSGLPITELRGGGEGISTQCFANLCLEFHANAPETLRIRPATLGQEYYTQYTSRLQPDGQGALSSGGVVSLQVWERYPLLPPGEIQEIAVAVFRDGAPLAGVEATMSVTLPDGSQQVYPLDLTEGDGQTSVALTIGDTPNGTLIPYRVCVVGVTDPPVCVGDGFVVWDSP